MKDSAGNVETVELVPGGSNVAVTPENLDQYIELRALLKMRNQWLEYVRGEAVTSFSCLFCRCFNACFHFSSFSGVCVSLTPALFSR